MRPQDWRAKKIQQASKDIEAADWVAIDLEFTGLFRERNTSSSRLEKHYEQCAEDCKQFLVIQLGICAVQYIAGNWSLTPYNFYVYPFSERVIFTCDSSALTFLRDQGFSFDALLRDGHSYGRIKQNYYNNSTVVKREGVQQLIQCIADNKKPVVLHNGFLDMLHIYNRYIGDLPMNLGSFCSEWLNMFRGGVFDTRYIATKCCNTPPIALRLYDLYEELVRRDDTNMIGKFNLTVRSYEGTATKMTESYDRSHTAAHQAGYDAYLTALVFLLQCGDKLVKKLTPEGTMSQDWAVSTGAEYVNHVVIMNVPPGILNIAQAAKAQQLLAQPSSLKQIATPPTVVPDEESTPPTPKRQRRGSGTWGVL